MSGSLNSTELDFQSYKDSLIAYLKGQDIFKNFNFAGTNLNTLIELLSRNTQHNAFYQNQIASESFLDTVTLRESAVSHAKELNYVPRSRSSSSTSINITVFPNNNPPLITIPRYYPFSGNNGDGQFIFTTDQVITLTNNGGRYTINDVPVYEGRIVKEYFTSNTNTNYVIASANVDISSLSVSIRPSLTDTNEHIYRKAESLFGLDPTSNVYFIEAYSKDQYRIVFGNDVVGRSVNPGSLVTLTYRDCSGRDADGVTKLTPVRDIESYNVQQIQAINVGGSSYGGTERETVESIKFHAPRHYSIQRNAITVTDYPILIKQRFPNIQAITVFGGEQLDQKRYGKVVISAKPFGSQYCPSAMKNSILDFISDKTAITIDPIFVDPDYFFVEVSSDVYYDPNTTSKNASDIRSATLRAILNYNNTSLYDFSADFKYSKFINILDNADPSITSNDTDTRIIKRLTPTKLKETSYFINYNTPLSTKTNQRLVETSPFYVLSSDGFTLIQTWIRDDGKGKLLMYTINALGAEIILNDYVGSVDYKRGRIQLNRLYVNDYAGYIGVYVRTQSRDFDVKRNQIIIIDPSDCIVNVRKTVISS